MKTFYAYNRDGEMIGEIIDFVNDGNYTLAVIEMNNYLFTMKIDDIVAKS